MATINIFEADQRGRARMLGEKYGIKADPDDLKAFVISGKIRFSLESREDAESWAHAFPGIGEKYDRATEEDSTEKWADKYGGDLNLILGFCSDRKTAAYASGATTVSRMTLTISQAIQVVDATVTFGGIPYEDVESWLTSLRGAFLLTTTPAQLSLLKAVA